MLYYQLQKEAPNSPITQQSADADVQNMYVKKFVLFANEKLKYYFKETIDGNSYRSDKQSCIKEVQKGEDGRYGRLNDILLSSDMEKETRMKAYAQEDMIAAHMFEQ